MNSLSFRYKYDNIISLDLDLSERTTQEFAGPGMKSRVDQILAMDLAGDDGDDVSFSNTDSAISSPYLTYGNEVGASGAGGAGERERDRDDRSVRGDKVTASSNSTSRPRTGKRRDGSASRGGERAGGAVNENGGGARPKSAARKRETGGGGSGGGGGDYRGGGDEDELYPTARGLIKK